MVTVFLPAARRIQTTIVFRSGKRLTLSASRDFRWTKARGRFAELVALGVAGAPSAAIIDENSRDVARFGSRAARRHALGLRREILFADALVERARHFRTWLEHEYALADIKESLRQQPNRVDALELRCRILAEMGKLKEARAAAAEWVTWTPSSLDAREAQIELELAFDDGSAVTQAREMLAKYPERAALAVALGQFHFRRREYEEASGVWTGVAELTRDEELKRVARENAGYLQRYGTDGGFRAREKAKRYARMALVISVPIIALSMVLFSTISRWSIRREHARNAEEVRRLIESEQKKMDEITRHLTETTGLIFGSAEEIRTRADNGEAAAEFTYATMLIGGKGVAKDTDAGMKYLEKAAANNSREALKRLAAILREGKLIEADPSRAAELLQRAADLGSPRAAMDLAEMFLRGEGVEKDKSAAFALWVRAADGGNTLGMTRAGWALERGEGVERDVPRALEYYRKAAAKDDRWAIEGLAQLLMRRENTAADHDEAWTWIKKGAELGSVQLRMMFASAVLRGAKADAESGAKALPWLVQSAEGGSPIAQGMLGSCYLNGWGVPQDFEMAAGWLAKSEPSNQKSRAILGMCHAFGLGVRRDLVKAGELRARISDPSEQEWLDRYLEAATRVVKPETGLVPVFQQPPTYPAGLARDGINGRVLVRFVVGKDGFVRNAVVRESTRSEFEAPAILAVSCWRFAPLDGTDSINTEIPLLFTVNDEKRDGSESRP